MECGRRHPVCAEPDESAAARVRHRGRSGAVTTLGPQQRATVAAFLPDGRRFLFYALGSPETAGIYLGSLDGAPRPG